MIKKIVHLSDIHITTYKYHDLYEKQFERLYDELTVELMNYKYDEIRIAICGDLTHNKILISNEQMLIVSNFLQKLSTFGKVVIIPGNHDFLENNVERIDSITPTIEIMKNQNIVYYKNYGVYTDNNVKWVVYSLYNYNTKPTFEKTKGFRYVGLFHGPINGFSTYNNYEFTDVYDKINFHDCDIVLCGDIHKRDIKYLNSYDALINRHKDIPIIYSGSLIQQNFGESVSNHGYGCYDLITDKYEFKDLENDQPFLKFLITDLSDIENEKEILLNG